MIRLHTVGFGLAAATGLSLAAAGCSTTTNGPMATQPGVAAGTAATARLMTADGADVGTATATALSGGGVRVAVNAHDLPPGAHGAHIHAVGRCDAPDFTSAGGHWNPTGSQHGVQNPAGPHAGDMPNLLIGTNGEGSLAVNLPAGTYNGLMDADGAAMVIHSGPDDMRTDPSGNSGSRIACGVFMPEGM
ncbi:superoxide dismutase family protein [Stakelama saccharophila]|uniref:Superoxide dismutase family protein n=1 Tax=Stakelama saccharophila TaxID=3075605 RepID=A0ABZ0BCB9_9SPHN|nr:superoxide dismutase family protein [Stakelama sp. W311]WNO54311.1 superoxide dismutase family protein [Stakelama sp. W311]